jgi:hypothetical protein
MANKGGSEVLDHTLRDFTFRGNMSEIKIHSGSVQGQVVFILRISGIIVGEKGGKCPH